MLEQDLDKIYTGKTNLIVVYNMNQYSIRRLSRDIEEIINQAFSIRSGTEFIELNLRYLNRNQIQDLIKILIKQGCKFKRY